MDVVGREGDEIMQVRRPEIGHLDDGIGDELPRVGCVDELGGHIAGSLVGVGAQGVASSPLGREAARRILGEGLTAPLLSRLVDEALDVLDGLPIAVEGWAGRRYRK